MTDDLFELVDRDYDQVQREEYPRQIKTRRSSFNTIVEKFTNFRINRLKKKLEKEKAKALTEKYTESNYEDKIERRALKIAKLEEKIKILSRDEVPASYVDNRAIKLKKKMCDNLTQNIASLYSVGMENKEEIFAEEVVEEPKEELQEEVMASSASTVTDKVKEDELDVDTIDRQTITDTINEEFSNQAAKAEEISREDVEEVVDEKFANLSDEETIDRDAIEQTINEEFAKKEEEIEEYAAPNTDVSKEDIKDVVNEKFNELGGIPEMEDVVIKAAETIEPEQTVEEQPKTEESDMFRVSRNNTNNVRTSRFDSEGNVIKKFDYVPMTDEEIREAQIKLGWDEHGNPIKKEEPKKYDYVPMTDEEIREAQIKMGLDENGNPIKKEEPKKYDYVPMTDEEIREAQIKIGLDENGNFIETPKETEEKFVGEAEEVMPQYTTLEDKPVDNIDVVDNPEVVEQKSHSSATIDDYTALKERILKLKEQKEQTAREIEAARRQEEEMKERAHEMEEMLAESDKSVAASLEMLKAYSEALEEDCDRNRRKAEEAKSRAQESSDYIASHQDKLNDNQRLISEIDTLIGERVDPTSIKVR